MTSICKILRKKHFLWKYSSKDTEGMQTCTKNFKLFRLIKYRFTRFLSASIFIQRIPAGSFNTQLANKTQESSYSFIFNNHIFKKGTHKNIQSSSLKIPQTTKFHITLLEEKKYILKFKILIEFAFIYILSSYVHINSFIVNTNVAGE